MSSPKLTVGVLREAFRNLEAFRALFESDGIDTIRSDGIELSLWDLEYLYDQLPRVLPTRQYQAIELFLVQNLKEKQVAAMMGIDVSNPIGSYATSGLTKLLRLMSEGALPSFRMDGDES